MAKKKDVAKVIVTSTITLKALQTAQATMEGSYQSAREAFFKAIESTIKGKVTTNGEIVNAVCYSLSKGKISSLSMARDKKVAWLKNVEKLNNFLSSWVDIDKKGAIKLLTENKKSASLKKAKAGSEANGGKKVTFTKSEAIKQLNAIAESKDLPAKAKALIFQAIAECEA